MNKTSLIIITIGIIFAGLIFLGGANPKDNSDTSSTAQNVEIKDGVQYVTILARGGYSPQVSSATAGIPTKLIVKTNGTYDCSSSLMIRSIGFQKILPQNGDTEIDIGTPKAGEPLRGTCGMGMYSFLINFN